MRLIIEINGDLWHANPAKYEPKDMILAKWRGTENGYISAEDVWKQDAVKVEHLESFGYRVLVLWETDIRNGKWVSILEGVLDAVVSECDQNRGNS